MDRKRTIAASLLVALGSALIAVAQISPPPAAPGAGSQERATLTGDWEGSRSALQAQGFTVKPRLTQFAQALTSGDGDHGLASGGKADVVLNADLAKLGLLAGASLNVHAEYNYGHTANGRGGALLPANTALLLPGLDGSAAFDFTSVFVAAKMSDTAAVMVGKINMVDIAAGKPFMGGAGIDAFQHIAFVAPPSGILPPYLFGAIFSVRQAPASFTFMIYDPVSVVNRSGLSRPFAEGVTLRASVDFPVTLAGRSGHQGFSATYGTQDGTDLSRLGDLLIPPGSGGPVPIKENRYHVAYSFDQFLFQARENAKEGCGLFGQLAFSDGNPNPLDWSAVIGLGGTGLIPGRAQDRWGAGFFHYSVSSALKRSVNAAFALDDEQGAEIFYNAALTPWLSVAADLQVIDPAQSRRATAVVFGLRTSVKF